MAYNRKGKTLPCKICGEPYMDNISTNAVEITCAKCAMGLTDSLETQKKYGAIDFIKLADAIKSGKLSRFRNENGFSQSELAKRIGITPRHLRRIENSTYIPSSKVIRKIEIKVKNVRSA
jgi:DNA-binding XRE family transcriptional regulator